MIPFEVIALSPYARELFAKSSRGRVHRFHDRLGRAIDIDEWQPADWANLLSMYSGLEPCAQFGGVPLRADRRAAWLEQLLSRGPNLVARCGDKIIGHAALIRYDGPDSAELVAFVHHDYQGAGIGGALVDSALERARRMPALRQLWLAVPRYEPSAVSLYRSRGFRPQYARTSANTQRSASDEVWTLDLREAEAEATQVRPSAITAATRARLRAIASALRFVMIPLICAIVIAIVSEDPRGKALAILLAIASVVFGLAMHAREITRGTGV